jgi:hypothetical protein
VADGMENELRVVILIKFLFIYPMFIELSSSESE